MIKLLVVFPLLDNTVNQCKHIQIMWQSLTILNDFPLLMLVQINFYRVQIFYLEFCDVTELHGLYFVWMQRSMSFLVHGGIIILVSMIRITCLYIRWNSNPEIMVWNYFFTRLLSYKNLNKYSKYYI